MFFPSTENRLVPTFINKTLSRLLELLDSPATRNEVNDENNQSNHQQQVNKSAANVPKESNQPKHK
jgi:hypothetical protein